MTDSKIFLNQIDLLEISNSCLASVSDLISSADDLHIVNTSNLSFLIDLIVYNQKQITDSMRLALQNDKKGELHV